MALSLQAFVTAAVGNEYGCYPGRAGEDTELSNRRGAINSCKHPPSECSLRAARGSTQIQAARHGGGALLPAQDRPEPEAHDGLAALQRWHSLGVAESGLGLDPARRSGACAASGLLSRLRREGALIPGGLGLGAPPVGCLR